MPLIKVLWNMDVEEFNEILRDLPYWVRFMLKAYYSKIQKMKNNPDILFFS